MTMKKLITILITALAILAFSSVKTNAIPAFARKYQISCQVCHSPAAPALKAFGDEFAGNGFRLTEYESPRYFIPAGDDRLGLIRDFPIAVRMDGHVTYNFNNEGSADFGVPFGLKIMSGGELSEKLSYYFYFYMNERGEVAGVEDALLIFNDLLGTGVNVTIGQFQACDALFKRELRLTLEDYVIYTVKPGTSGTSLKYDRGIVLDYGLPTGTGFIAEIVNGSGIGEAGEGFVFDYDRYKNVLLKVSQDIGDFLSVGFFGYTGREVLHSSPLLSKSDIRMFGPDLALNIDDKLLVNLQYMQRTDSRVYLETPLSILLEDVTTRGGFGEVTYAPKGDRSNWYLTALYNYIDSDLAGADYQSATIHAGYLLRRNVRLVTEYTRVLSGVEYGKASMGFISAF